MMKVSLIRRSLSIEHRRDQIRSSNDGRGGLIPIGIYKELKSRKTCAICGKKRSGRPLEIDHIIPLSSGGTNHQDNLRAICHDCHIVRHKA